MVSPEEKRITMSNHRSDLIEGIAAPPSQLRGRGWEYPIYALTVATNGNIQAVEFVADGVEGRMLASYERDRYARLPIHIIFVDSWAYLNLCCSH